MAKKKHIAFFMMRALSEVNVTRLRPLMVLVSSMILMQPVISPLRAEVEYIELPAVPLEKLSSDDFEEREAAYAAIQKWSAQNLTSSPELLYKAWRSNDDPEVQSRCNELMKEMLRRREFSKGFLGIQMSSSLLPNKPKGQAGRQAVRVLNVLPNTPAQQVGLRGGDMILRVDELDLSSPEQGLKNRQIDLMLANQAVDKFSGYIKSKQPKQMVILHLLRGDERLTKEVVLMQLDPANERNPEKAEAEFEAYLSEWLEKMKLGRN
ncbi:MAG: hypothetical protein ACPIA7_03335 [Akkermansiaceae bacterium]